MSQWQPGFQYPMQTGFPGGNQFQQNPQFQPQNLQFQPQGGLGIPNGGGLVPQPTGFPGQRPQPLMQSGLPPGSNFMQPQTTGFPGGFQQSAPPVPSLPTQFQQSRPPPVPPVPPLPAQFQQNQPSFLNAPPQPNRLLSASPGFGGLVPQQTGFPGQQSGGGMLVPQMTGFVDPRLQMMSQTFMPMNTSAGIPQLQPQPQNLVQSFQQHNQTQRGATTQQMSWTLTKVEKKSYDNIFRQWVKGERFMSGPTAIEVFGVSGLSKDDLARIWTLADIDDRGKLNLEEFHVAMGLIYRRLNGMQLPDQLPRELIPSSRQDLGDTVDRVKELLERESRTHSPSSTDSPMSILKNRSFYGAAPSFESNRDATIYKHTDEEPTSVYKPKWRHVDRDAIRSRDDEDNPSADLQDLKRRVANTAQMLDRTADADAQRTKEDEELAREMSDLNYRVKRIQEDLEFNSRGTQSASRANERRRLERELLTLMHERIPEVERKIKDREERKERDRRQWARDRDNANERFGRYENRDDYSRRDDRNRPYSRGEDRDSQYNDRSRPYSRGDDRPSSRGEDYSRGASDREDRDTRERSYDPPRSPPPTRNAPRLPSATTTTRRGTPPVQSQASPSPSMAAMTPEQRKAYTQEQAKLRIQERMTKLGVISPSTSLMDTSVEDRLQQEKKEAEEKARAAEKQAEEREKARRERLENAKALKEGRTTPGVPTTPTPTSSFASATPVSKSPASVPSKTAPPPPKPRARNAPAPPVRAPVPTPTPTRSPSVPVSIPKVAPSVPAIPKTEVDPEEAKLRAREEALRKAREEREKARQERERKLKEMEMEEKERAQQELERAMEEEKARKERERVMEEKEKARKERERAIEEREKARQEWERALQESEEQEAAAARLEEEQYQQRLEALKAKATSPAIASPSTQPTSTALPVPTPPDLPHQNSASTPSLTPAEKSTNPFSRLLKEGGTSVPTTPAENGTATTSNPWAKPLTSPISIPSPSRSPAPISSKTSYQTAPSSAIDDDWEDIKEKDDDDDDGSSSDGDELMTRSGRADIAQALFGNIRRPASAAPISPVPTSPAPTSSPVVVGESSAPPPPPPPPALVAPPQPAADPTPLATPQTGRGALFAAIQGGRALRPTKTADKSGPPLSGRVLGDSGPPVHINTNARPPSPPPAPSIPALIISASPETPVMANKVTSKSDNRQSVGWFSERAADLGGSPVIVEKFPSTFDVELNESTPADVLVDEHPDSDSSLMADIDKSTVHRARSLYNFEGEGKEDLSFDANIMIIVNPSKSGGDWWYGKLVTSGKSGLFPKTYVEVVDPRKARAVYSYSTSSADELSFTEDDMLDIVDTTEEEWWKAEKGGGVFMVPAGYLELVEGPGNRSIHATTAPIDHRNNTIARDNGTADDSESSSEYHSFDDDNDDGSIRATRERERQLVLEAAGLIVQTDVGSPLRRRSTKRRPAPPAPDRKGRNDTENLAKDLPPIPAHVDIEDIETQSTTPEPELSYEARLDDAFARYEAFKNRQATPNRLSVVSIDSSFGPASSSSSVGTAWNNSNVREPEGGRYTTFLNFLRSKTPDIDARDVRRKSASTLNISAPIIQGASVSRQNPEEEVHNDADAPFGMSWVSLVDKTVLDEIPARERRRQESIFELINTEIAYVRDLQLIVEVFYSTILPLLSDKEITVVFANIEDILLTNTAFLSSLEKHQKECRLYIDKIGDILLSHLPNMGVYMEYCVNQSVAIKMLQSVRESKPELGIQLQRIRDDNPAVRNLDLSSFLLIPMQRITRYPLLVKKILQYTDVGKEQEAISNAREMAEILLDHINETIREQQNQETLRQISQDLWIGHARLDLTGATRNMGNRRLLKEGVLFKAKSGRKLRVFLCSDILLLTDEGIKILYRLPIQLAYASVKESSRSRDETGFQIVQQNPRNGDTVSLRAPTPRECQQWIQEISRACKKARQAEERAAQLLAST